MAVLEGNLTTWRIADGVLKTGRGREGDSQKSDITGILKNFCYFEGSNDEGERYAQIEVNLEDEDGQDVRVKSSVGLQATNSNVAAAGLMMGLLKCKQGDDIGIFPELAKKAHDKYGVKPTFVKVGVCVSGDRYKPVKTDWEDFPGENSRERFPHILAAFKAHPAYKQRVRQESGDVDLSIFSEIAEEGKWADPFGEAKPVYLEAIGKPINELYSDYSEIPGDVLAKFADYYRSSKDKQPKALAKFAPASKDEDEYNPFEDQ